MKISRNAATPRSSLSNGPPSFGTSVVAVSAGVLATAIAGVGGTAILLIVDAVRVSGPPQALLACLGYMSVLIGSGYAAKRCGRRGWAHGAVSALLSFALIIVWLHGTSGYTALGNSSGIQALAIVAFTGAAGGILGLALRKS